MSTTITKERDVATIFNSAVAAAAIGAAWEIGLLDTLRDQDQVDVRKFATEHDLDSGSMEGIVTALAVVNVVERHQGMIVAGRLLDETYQNKSLFHWFALGSGGLFSRMQHVLRNENRVGTFYHRDSAAIAYACRDINRQHFDPVFLAALDGLEYQVHTAVDLGSGAGERLMQILGRYPGATGIGIDLAEPALKLAAAESLERGFGGRLSFYEGDACNMTYHDDFAQVNLMTCFLMGHDFWPRHKCVLVLRRLRNAFPKVRRFFLGDTTRVLLDCAGSKHAVTEEDVPIFTLGFEVGHALMGVYLPTMEDWEGVFAEGGWRCVKKHLVQSSYLSVIFELEHS